MICRDLLVRQINSSNTGIIQFDDCWAVLNRPCGNPLPLVCTVDMVSKLTAADEIICTGLLFIHLHPHYVIVVKHLGIPSFQFLVSFQRRHVLPIFPYRSNIMQLIIVQFSNGRRTTKKVIKKIVAYVFSNDSTKSSTTDNVHQWTDLNHQQTHF